MASKSKQKCKYGASCYRKNEAHLETFEHDREEEEVDKNRVATSSASSDSESDNENDDDRGRKSSSSRENNKENRVDLSKTLDLPPDHHFDTQDKCEKIDLTQVKGKTISDYAFELIFKLTKSPTYLRFKKSCRRVQLRDENAR